MRESMALTKTTKQAIGRQKILVVEDEPGMREILFEHLNKAGYDVVSARDGMQAWEVFERERPDLVTLDLNIPRLSGFRLIQLLKQGLPSEARNVPVIVVTGLDYEEAEEVGVSGADDFITKPFNPVELLGKVQAVLAKQV